MKKCIIFDAMGVIFTVEDDTNDLLVPYVLEKNKTMTRERINEMYNKASLGLITSEEFWKTMKVCKDGMENDVCEDYLKTKLTLDEEFISIAKKLKKDYILGILSNDVSEWSTFIRKECGIDDIVDFSIISGDVGLRKPNSNIYRIALERAGASAQNCVFIDDREKNLIPAAEQGMHIIKFSRKNRKCNLKNVVVIKSFCELEEKMKTLWYT